MEAEFAVLGEDFLLEPFCIGEGPAVELEQVLDRHEILRSIEVGRVGEQEAQRVAHAAVAFDDALENRLAEAELARVVGGGDPETEDFSAELR